MKKTLFLFLICLFVSAVSAQQGFHFEKDVNKVSVPFKLINNLVFVPIKVNGIELNFLLDTGVAETILFSLEDKKEVRFFNAEKILLKGLGSQAAVEGLKSTNNILEFSSLKNRNHMLYIVLDPDFNLSSHIGIPVNGIIGYQFFRNNLVEINYQKKRVIVYKDTDKNRTKIEKKFNTIPITIEKLKPYLKSTVYQDNRNVPVKLLIDIGNSDAVWLFQGRSESIKVPLKNFDDFLGRGFSGDIEGKRGRIQKFQMADFEFNNPVVAFPDSISIRNVTIVPDRMGSVGGEIMKRFTVIFDYQKQQMYLKKNSDYQAPFSYNKSGVEVQHNGLQWVQETVRMETVPLSSNYYESDGTKVTNEFKYKFQLKPIYEVANVRKNSPAANAGLKKGDIILLINNNPIHTHSLQEINALFKSEEEKWITLEVERKSEILKFRFQLYDIL
ncbi:PDZ domain-containing protein [Flavobacterium rhamnosiphilum]|uniref:PDZ domain-containing protein n=1 Tax=Flavobacterium rhamnosiphilum TaxID=2541724 RepID=A0A4V2Z8Y6_9FLAO|nr:PDZ domain-containing protein [Flavobacterium rhamnosiphilum]TDE42240.1 PDZ domain-containing protein [Flavobacterium rhamnosiphilum]